MKKCCTKCKIEKELTEFFKSKITKDNLNSWCKICSKEAVNRYNSTEKGKKKNVESTKKYKINNPEKYKQICNKWIVKKQGIYEWYENETCLYIGQSISLNRRISLHKSYFKNSELAKKEKQSYLYPLLRQHQNPQIRIIEECSPEVLLKREQYYIDIKKPLYNKYSK